MGELPARVYFDRARSADIPDLQVRSSAVIQWVFLALTCGQVWQSNTPKIPRRSFLISEFVFWRLVPGVSYP